MNLRFFLIPVIALVAACSSGNRDDGTQGALKLDLTASSSTTRAVVDDATAQLAAANITIRSVEARSLEDGWVIVDTGLPVTIDLMPLLHGGTTLSLPADLIPDGSYNALNVMIGAAELTLQDGTHVALTPPGTGWSVLLAVDFTVAAGQATTIALNVRCDSSFHLINGTIEFDPVFDVSRVERTKN